ncbi:MAG TPA: heterodisulfide reductase-related iron-sulfur binding cluster [Candidatus Limnocylindrales bacterium]|nr:heterodisulfide reductase-related iron-sulfur binding cluster [Candidatus Limnocylindrales bacterium]
MTVAPITFDVEPARGCIHCGVCLESCPTYLLTRLETESPRGRIHLMQQLAAGRVDATDTLRLHLDRCLACRACEAVCPSGVGYGALIENARAAIEASGVIRRPAPASIARRARLGILADPARLAPLARLLSLYERTGLRRAVRASGLRKRLPPALRRLEGLYPPLARAPYRAPAVPATPIARVALLIGCVMRVAYGDVHTAAARVLSRLGVAVVDAPGQVCCGALHAHAGERADAIRLAKTNIQAFEAASLDAIVVDAAGCGAHLKSYAHLLEHDAAWADRAAAFTAKVRDVTEYLASLPGGMQLGTLEARVTYQDPCHLAHAQRIRTQPRSLLDRVAGLELIEMAESDVCCGSAGSYNLQQPVYADALLERKLDAIDATGANVVVSANPGCMLQIQSGLADRGRRVEVLHIVEVLDRAMA